MVEWLTENWLSITVPTVVFLAFFIVALWIRRLAYKALDKRLSKTRWQGSRIVIQTTRAPFLHWWLILGAFVATQISVLPSSGKELAVKILGSLLVTSLTWVAITLTERLLRFYMG